VTGSDGSNKNEWHIYDMEVQTVIEEAWTQGEQTIDIGQHFPGCPYIINFCNMTQVRRTTGAARPIRRQPCPSYPKVKLTPAEIASMLHRKEERKKEFAAEVDRRIKELKNKKHKKAKKAVKHIMNHLLHPTINLKDLKPKKNGLNPPQQAQSCANLSPLKAQAPVLSQQMATTSNGSSNDGFLLPPRRTIGHPSAISEAGFPAVVGRRNHYTALGSSSSAASSVTNPHYKRFHDYASFSSFSDTSSHIGIVRRPSVDTISTYLSSQYRYGGSSRTASSYYGGSFGGSQDLIDMYGHETDSVFTDEDAGGDPGSFRGSYAGGNGSVGGHQRNVEPAWPHGLNKRVLSDPAIHFGQPETENESDLYVNLQENLSLHSRHSSIASHHHGSLMRSSQNSLAMTSRSPQRGDTVHNTPTKSTSGETGSIGSSQNGTLRKRPVPTPRTILNTTNQPQTPQRKEKIERLIRKYSQFVIDPNGADDYCPVCNGHLDEQSGVHSNVEGEDMTSVICLSSCQHKTHIACLKWTTPELSSSLKCPTCGTISGLLNGDMPTLGASMSYKVIPKGLPGYEDYHAIQITYNMSSGVQDARHAFPSSPYYAIGFPKSAFLPDTELGRIVLKLLEKAFNQHLTFTLVTNKGSRDAMVAWNTAIGHKTEFGPSENERNSYPDPAFLEDVARQLARLGISTEIMEDDEETTNV